MNNYREIIDEVDWIPLQQEYKTQENQLLRRSEDTQKTVRMLPSINRYLEPLERDKLMMYALACRVGEYSSLNSAQIFCINKMFHEKPEAISFADWVEGVLDQAHIQTRVVRHIVEKMDYTLHSAMEAVLNTMQTDRKLILRLLRSKIEDMDWRDLTIYLHWKPITASRFMLATMPCEHVVLCKRMLHWARITPDTTDRKATYIMPETAPEDWKEYETLEWSIRRRQRCYFPGLTSLEAGILILSEFEHKIFF